MTVVYLVAAFAAGWISSWKVAEQLARKALRHPGLFVKAITRLEHERLLRLLAHVQAEVDKRRAVA